MSDSNTTDAGALPGLVEPKGEALGAPKGAGKRKSNVSSFAIVGMVVASLLFVVAGLLLWQRHKRKEAEATGPVLEAKAATPGMPRAAFMEKNEQVEDGGVERDKAEIKKAEEEEKARMKDVDQAQAEASRRSADPKAGATASNQAQATSNASRQGGGSQEQPKRPPTPDERKRGSGVLLDSSDGKLTADSQAEEGGQRDREVQVRMASAGVAGGTPAAGPGQASSTGAGAGADSLGARLQPTAFQARSAGQLSDLNFLLKRGTGIPCELKTGIDTTLPGIVMCQVMSDVLSANGAIVLISRGATVFGEQQSSLKQGQARTFAIWNRIDNPDGTFANVDSPAADGMGYSGIPGYVDTHFMQRFGGAVLISVIRDFSTAAAQRSSGGGTNQNQQTYSNTQAATQDMAAEALRNSINIPPTLTTNPGSIVYVMVARDVSFQNVYGLDR